MGTARSRLCLFTFGPHTLVTRRGAPVGIPTPTRRERCCAMPDMPSRDSSTAVAPHHPAVMAAWAPPDGRHMPLGALAARGIDTVWSVASLRLCVLQEPWARGPEEGVQAIADESPSTPLSHRLARLVDEAHTCDK